MTPPDEGSSKEGPSERHQARAATPPRLAGWEWGGDIDGPVCVTVRDRRAEAWWWDARDRTWNRPTLAPLAEQIMAAWALSLRAERDHLKRREADIIEAVTPVCDGGQYRNDIVSAIQRVARERDTALAEARRLRVEVATLRAANTYERIPDS